MEIRARALRCINAFAECRKSRRKTKEPRGIDKKRRSWHDAVGSRSRDPARAEAGDGIGIGIGIIMMEFGGARVGK